MYNYAHLQQAAGEITHGIPHGEEAYYDHGEEDKNHVEGMDADGIGIDNEGACRLSQCNDAEGLLQPTEQQA